MFRALVTATIVLLASFAAQASSKDFDQKLFRTLCVKAVFEASKVPKCMADAQKKFNLEGEILSGIATCKLADGSDKRLDCITYVAENASGVDLPRLRGICDQLVKPELKGNCYRDHLRLNDEENKKEIEKFRLPNYGVPPRNGGSAR